MSLAKPRPAQSAPPEVVELPDGRKRYTRYYEVVTAAQIGDALFAAYAAGDADDDVLFANCRCTQPGRVGPGPGGKSYFQVDFEELPATAEQQIGNPTKIKLDDGRSALEVEFWQFTAGSYTPGTVGVSTAAADASAILQREEATDDGTLRKIKRTYVYGGTIHQSDTTKNNGALLIRTIVAAVTAPSTPSGYTLIDQDAKNVNGHELFTYTFAKGDGQISREDDNRNNGALLIATITHLTAPGAADPVATLSGYTRTSVSTQEADGHEVWRAVFAKGTGQISRRDDTKNNGKLLTATISYLTVPGTLGVAGSNPISTPAGYILASEEYTERDGHRIWTASYAKGDGEMSRSVDYRQSGDEGTNGITITTIRHLTASSVGTDPTSAPASTVKISEDKSDQDGYRVWTVVYAKGTGEVSRSISYRQSVDGGTTGLTFWTIRHLTAISVGTDPTSNPGSAIKTGEDHVDQDGYRVWTVNWAKGTGVVTTDVSGRSDGSIAYVYTTLSGTSGTPSYTGGGTAYLTDLTNTLADGYYVNRAVYILPPATQTLKKMRQVRMPGDVEFETITGGHNLLVTSDSNRLLKCDVEISYATTQLTDTPWKLDYGTTYRATYIRTGQTVAEYEYEVMSFFVASSATVSGTDDTYNGMACSSYSATITASSPTSLPTGATVLDIDHEPYLVATDGTVLYRRTKVSYTF